MPRPSTAGMAVETAFFDSVHARTAASSSEPMIVEHALMMQSQSADMTNDAIMHQRKPKRRLLIMFEAWCSPSLFATHAIVHEFLGQNWSSPSALHAFSKSTSRIPGLREYSDWQFNNSSRG